MLAWPNTRCWFLTAHPFSATVHPLHFSTIMDQMLTGKSFAHFLLFFVEIICVIEKIFAFFFVISKMKTLVVEKCSKINRMFSVSVNREIFSSKYFDNNFLPLKKLIFLKKNPKFSHFLKFYDVWQNFLNTLLTNFYHFSFRYFDPSRSLCRSQSLTPIQSRQKFHQLASKMPTAPKRPCLVVKSEQMHKSDTESNTKSYNDQKWVLNVC